MCQLLAKDNLTLDVAIHLFHKIMLLVQKTQAQPSPAKPSQNTSHKIVQREGMGFMNSKKQAAKEKQQ